MEGVEYEKFRQIAIKITKGDERYEDLLHDVLLQLSSNVKWGTLPEKERTFFFVRAITNQFNSNNSYFQRTYRRFSFEQLTTQEQIDEPYYEKPTMEWVRETLDRELKNNPNSWYNVGIFKMYLEHKKIEEIHKKTRIPKYSIRNTLREMKVWIKQEWLKYQNKI